MAASFDTLVLLAVQDGLATYRDDAAAFAAIFGPLATEDPGLVESWHAGIWPTGSDVPILAAYQGQAQKAPIVVVSLESEETRYQGLGRSRMGTRSVARIHILGSSASLVKALYDAVRQSLLDRALWITKNGGGGLNYRGGGDVHPAESVQQPHKGLFERSQRWEGTGSHDATPTTVTPKTVYIHATGITVDGNAGGMAAEEG